MLGLDAGVAWNDNCTIPGSLAFRYFKTIGIWSSIGSGQSTHVSGRKSYVSLKIVLMQLFGGALVRV